MEARGGDAVVARPVAALWNGTVALHYWLGYCGRVRFILRGASRAGN
jgi:hypothetical protein